MGISIDPTKLTAETRTALVRFGRAASRYRGAQRKKEFTSIGDERVLAEKEISPRSVVADYFDAKRALLKTQDPTLKDILNQIDLDKLLEQTEGLSAKAHDDAHRKMVAIETQLSEFAKKLK